MLCALLWWNPCVQLISSLRSLQISLTINSLSTWDYCRDFTAMSLISGDMRSKSSTWTEAFSGFSVPKCEGLSWPPKWMFTLLCSSMNSRPRITSHNNPSSTENVTSSYRRSNASTVTQHDPCDFTFDPFTAKSMHSLFSYVLSLAWRQYSTLMWLYAAPVSIKAVLLIPFTHIATTKEDPGLPLSDKIAKSSSSQTAVTGNLERSLDRQAREKCPFLPHL